MPSLHERASGYELLQSKKTKQQHQGESDNNGKTHSYTYNIVCGARLITDTLHSLLTVCVSMCFGVAEVEEKNNQHTRQSQKSRDTV